MKKVAFFVEGETEQEFLCKLFKEVAAQKSISLIINKLIYGGKSGLPRTTQLIQSEIEPNAKCEVWIYVSGNDNRVPQDILDNYQSLVNSGFSRIVGIKDLVPQYMLHELTNHEFGIRFALQNCTQIPTNIVIAVAEVEAWFLSETNHFVCIDNRLTQTFIHTHISSLGFDPFTQDMTLRINPAADLHNLYQLVGKSYRKSKNQRHRLVDCLNYPEMYFNLKNSVVKLSELFFHIDEII